MVDNHHHGPHKNSGWVPPSPQDKVRTSVSAVHDFQMQLEQGHRPDTPWWQVKWASQKLISITCTGAAPSKGVVCIITPPRAQAPRRHGEESREDRESQSVSCVPTLSPHWPVDIYMMVALHADPARATDRDHDWQDA